MLVDHMQNGASASVTIDSTSNDQDGSKKAANEPAETSATIGDGQQTDGSDDYIDYGVATFVLPADNVTIEGFIYIDPTHSQMDGNVKHLLSLGYADGGGSIFFDDRVGFGTNSIGFNAHMDNDVYLTTQYDNTITSAGWYYIAGTFDKDAGGKEEMKLWVDAVKGASASGTSIHLIHQLSILLWEPMPVLSHRHRHSRREHSMKCVFQI
ncbi:LamG-like jellyroll fold domain-containing protein [Chloroflexota bacterium]